MEWVLFTSVGMEWVPIGLNREFCGGGDRDLLPWLELSFMSRTWCIQNCDRLLSPCERRSARVGNEGHRGCCNVLHLLQSTRLFWFTAGTRQDVTNPYKQSINHPLTDWLLFVNCSFFCILHRSLVIVEHAINRTRYFLGHILFLFTEHLQYFAISNSQQILRQWDCLAERVPAISLHYYCCINFKVWRLESFQSSFCCCNV